MTQTSLPFVDDGQDLFYSTSSGKKVVSWKISLCLNPTCLHANVTGTNICQCCGSQVLLGGRYRAVRALGSGGFACTFAAIDELCLNSPCVIKQFLPRQQDCRVLEISMQLFQQEAAILRDLGDHPQIPKLMAFFEQEQQTYLVQEYVQGQSLCEELDQVKSFNETQVLQVFTDLLPVLQFIHDRQVIHRDIKLSNVIRKTDGTLVLIDFGSATYLGHHARFIAGTPGYAAPEQLRGIVYPASDLYSLGVLGVRLLTGCVPQSDEDDPLYDIQQQRWDWRRSNVSVSSEFAQVLDVLLQTQVQDRYQTSTVVWHALNSSVRPNNESASISLPSKFVSDLTDNFRKPDSSTFPEQRVGTDELLEMPILISETEIHQTPEMEVHYSILQNLLAAQQYRQADQETWNLMLRVAGREQERYLDVASLAQFPLRDLDRIDRLWQGYSDGHFGLRLQAQLYQYLGGTSLFDYNLWVTFGQQLGWCGRNGWLSYADLTFTVQAPFGHLPVCCIDVANRQGVSRGACGWWRLGFVTLVFRLLHTRQTV